MANDFPFFQFFASDWLIDERLRMCSVAARGLWIDMLCLMHRAPRRGFLELNRGTPLPPEMLARVAGISVEESSRLTSELLSAGVPSIEETTAVLYSRRMVNDERKRHKCADAGRKGGGNPRLKVTFKGDPKGESKGRPKVGLKGTFKPESEIESESESDPPIPPKGAGEGVDATTESFALRGPDADVRQPTPPHAPAPRKPPNRPPDEAFVAILDVCGYDLAQCTDALRGSANKALQQIRAVCPASMDPPALALEIRTRARRYRDQWPDRGAFGPGALAKEWPALDGQRTQRRDRAMRRATETPVTRPAIPVGQAPPDAGSVFAEFMRKTNDRGLGEAVGA